MAHINGLLQVCHSSHGCYQEGYEVIAPGTGKHIAIHRGYCDCNPSFTGLLRFQNTLTTNFQKRSLTWEIDYYSYKKLSDKNSGFKVRECSNPDRFPGTWFQDSDEIQCNIYQSTLRIILQNNSDTQKRTVCDIFLHTFLIKIVFFFSFFSTNDASIFKWYKEMDLANPRPPPSPHTLESKETKNRHCRMQRK